MKTLKLAPPFGNLFSRSLIYLVIFCIFLELLARIPSLGNILPNESYGTSHPHFETQLIRLKEREKNEGHIDCIFLGNSQVLYGINPVVVEQTYFEKTNRSIRCQNFGLGGLKPSAAEGIARLLIKNFHPSIIIFGTGLWDYSAEQEDTSILSSPWVRYQLGNFSIDGWLYEYSFAYRYIFGLDRYLKSSQKSIVEIDNHGHTSFIAQANLTEKEQLEYFDGITKKPELAQLQVDGFREVLSINSRNTQIIIVETPSNPVFYSLKRKARILYPDFKTMLVTQSALVDSDLWLTQDSINVPSEDWYDFLHLNEEGAVYFSRKLGEFLAGIDLQF
jgi:hypothetical protein